MSMIARFWGDNMDEISTLGELEGKLSDGKRTAVLFHAGWCPFCRRFRPVFENYEGKTKLKMLKALIDDEDNELWVKYDIEVVPTVIVFEKGRVSRRADAKAGVGLTEEDLKTILA